MHKLPINIPTQAPPAGQRGYALLLGMVLIVVMTVFGVFALNGSVMQARMAANFQDNKVAFEAAEQTLRWGESWLQSRTTLQRPFPCDEVSDIGNCTAPNSVLAANLVPYAVETESPTSASSAWQTVGLQYGEDPQTGTAVTPARSIPGLANGDQPYLLLEQAFIDRDDLAGNPQQGRVFYRVLAASTGERDTTISILESAVAKRFE
jgi:type IV pilus assembly protein PilX